jgi:hypothetical protein
VAIFGLLLLVGGIVFLDWWAGRTPPWYDEIQAKDCRTRYAAAHTHADTLRVDFHLEPRFDRRFNAPMYCGTYRDTGHF